ncbi:MAG TPA: DUF1993 domain-containing protein [Noviherbaspirillum sp.]|uniref:DUF1993 domain-containing protein n=1 Tax=Noviherbaspirillum sp. TaxID=1926288 RepID=UPI002B492C44|nr:DUF1993 domain-containing protein [Noviherbaspirillum sp.]HJV86208.1 DUF1993 domain-containing protein [Noviherbaspirillum sp.]
MPITLYAASIPVFTQMLHSLDDVLSKAEAHASAKRIDPHALLQARLFPDMFPLIRQVQLASDFAKGTSARLAGVAVPAYEDNEQSFADLHARITTTLAFIESLSPEQINGRPDQEIVIQPDTPRERRFSSQSVYLMHYGLPQFFFHVTTAYALLRHNGIEIGKRDFVGTY